MKKNFLFTMIFGLVITGIMLLLAEVESTKDGVIMANTFLTTQIIAREALLRLRNFLVTRALIHTDYSNSFAKQGDTIRIKKPPTYIADEFDGTINLQDITESHVLVTLDKIADVSVNWTSKERALNIDQFGDQVLNPAVEAIAQKIDYDILSTVYKDVPYFVGTAGTTPDALEDFANARKLLNKLKAPQSLRSAIWDPDADAKFSILDAIVNAEKSGSTQALRDGAIGKIQGLNNYMSQNIVTHTAGTFTAAAGTKVKTQPTVGASSIAIKSSDGGTGTILAGDLLKIGNYYYVATADADAVANDVTVSVYPLIQTAHAVDTDVTFPDKTAGGHVANLAFHKNAFAFVQRPLEPPMGGAESYTVNFEGLSIRVTAGYDMSTKKEIVSLDLLYGIKTIFPELGVRVLG